MASGRKTWETNTYHIHEAYRGKPMKRPYDFKIPRAIYLKIQWMLKKKKFKALWNSIYEHIQDDIADHIQRINRFNTNFLRLDSKINLKTTTDPPKERQKSPNCHLFSKYNLHYRDQWAISRYSESSLSIILLPLLLHFAFILCCFFGSWLPVFLLFFHRFVFCLSFWSSLHFLKVLFSFC